MSSGFTIGTETFWGSNGAIGTYIAVMMDLAVGHFGAQDPLAVRLTQEHEFRRSGAIGTVVLLDEWLLDADSRDRFCWLLDTATDQILRQGTFTDAGREWIATVVTRLQARIAAVTFQQGAPP
jgi:hypothetical protein